MPQKVSFSKEISSGDGTGLADLYSPRFSPHPPGAHGLSFGGGQPRDPRPEEKSF
jgi:hypothetical protein